MDSDQESVATLYGTLTNAIKTATSIVPQSDDILPPAEGITLLNVRNELFLSYLQHLAFLILFKLRNSQANGKKDETDGPTQEEIVKKLVELRVYIEKGVRPLEGRLKYQIDKVVHAADDAARSAKQQSNGASKLKSKKSRKQANGSDDSDAESRSDGSRSASEGEDEEDEDEAQTGARPTPGAFIRPATADKRESEAANDGVYRPPRVAPTAMPTYTSQQEKTARKPAKSATIDEYIAAELSGAPTAEPSIGSTIVEGGRGMKSKKEREQEAERTAYEESMFVRLPKQGKQERASMRNKRTGFGGEDWRDLSSGLDRINKLTKKKSGSGGALNRSRKRTADSNDGPGFGESFGRKRRMHG